MSSEHTEVKAENATGSSEGDQPAVEAINKDEAPAEQAAAKNPVDELKEKLAEQEKKYLYLYSEFENFRRRVERDRLDFVKFGHEGFIRELLNVQDNFERAITHAKSFQTEKGSPLALIQQGVEMILFQFSETLKAQGLAEVKSMGMKFDPNFHEAMGEEVSESAEAGSITKELVKGYTLHGRLIRAAKVMVAKKN